MNNKTLLVVDDSAIVRTDLSGMLQSHGFKVLTAEDGDVAAELAANHPEIDLCIVDFNMPTMNGLQTMHAIRGNAAHTDVPIFILTTECADSLIKQGRDEGATAWIVKPWKEEPLLAGIRQAVGE